MKIPSPSTACATNLKEGDDRLAASAHDFLKPELGGQRDAFTISAVHSGGESVLQLVRAGSLNGRVVTASGMPLFAVDVSVVKQRTTRGRPDGWIVVATGRTDDRGQFSVGALHPGAYIIKTVPTPLGRVAGTQVGLAVATASSQSGGRSTYLVQVRPGTRETVPDIVADIRPLVTVRGTIVREGGVGTTRLTLTARLRRAAAETPSAVTDAGAGDGVMKELESVHGRLIAMHLEREIRSARVVRELRP